MEHMIEVSGLKKAYGDIQAVQGIDFYVERGKVFAFLGPNGAGKSTTIDILSTLLRPDAGEVHIDGLRIGKDDDAIRQRIGVVFQQSILDGLLTVEENLQTRAKFYGKDKAERKRAIALAAEATDIGSFLSRRYEKLSGGQRRRADISRALVNTPSLLFLDEPTTGLDPQTRRSVWNTVFETQRQNGMTVFMTTHYMEEAAMADYIIIIDHGRIAARGTPAALKDRYARDTVRLVPRDLDALQKLLVAEGYAGEPKEGGIVQVPVQGMETTLALLNKVAPQIADFEVIHGTMDDVFINVTGEAVREA